MLRSIAVFLLVTGALCAQAPAIASVVNGGDYSNHLSPGLLATIFGSNFGSGPASSISVSVGGKAGFVSSVAPNQLAVELPVDAAVGATTLTVTVAGQTPVSTPISLDSFAPSLISANASGTGAALVLTLASASITVTSPAHTGDTLIAYALGLGATTPVTPTGFAPTTANVTATAPTLTVGGTPATISYAGIAPGTVGIYQINFKVPANLQGSQPMVLSIGGKATTSVVTLPIFGITSLLSNASFGSAGTTAPGSIVSLFANGLGTTDQSVGFPSTTFQGVSVTFNGTAAPLFHLTATAGQIDLLVPYELPTAGTVNVQISTPSGMTPSFPIAMAAATPGLYYLADPSTPTRFNVLAQFNNTGWLAMPAGMAAALKIPGHCTANNVSPLSLCGQPAAPGDYLVLYTTGLGKATPNGDPNGIPLKTGAVPPADGSVLYKTVATPTVTVGGLPATVVFSGIAPGYPGEYQVDFQVPVGVTGDDVPVVVSISGAMDMRTISIQPKPGS